MDEGPLGIHEVELVVEPGPGLHDGGRVRQAADRPLHAGQVAARHHRGRLVVDTHLWKEEEDQIRSAMVRRGSVGSKSACCKAGPSSIHGSAPQGGFPN